MKRLALAVFAAAMAGTAYASQEGCLPISSFRLESDGAGASGKIAVAGKLNDKAQIVELRVTAFGKEHVVPPEHLRTLADLRANGIRISYENGYEELDGRVVYVQLQVGVTSHTAQTAVISIMENGRIEVSKVRNEPSPEAGSEATERRKDPDAESRVSPRPLRRARRPAPAPRSW